MPLVARPSISRSKRAPLNRYIEVLCLMVAPAFSQVTQPTDPAVALYQQLRNSSAIEKSVRVENVVLQRDRVMMTLGTGTIYFPAPIAGKVRSAVFVGSGTFKASPPPVGYEQDNLRRLLKAEDISADFKTAIFRFTDETGDVLTQGLQLGTSPSEQACRIAGEFEPRLLKETGINISARQLEAILNRETPGVFLGQFEGGKRGRFTYLFDSQSRTLVSNFGINAGEKGIIFAYDEAMFSNDVWMAFYGKEDYEKGQVAYSDFYDLVETTQYRLNLNLMEPKRILGLIANLDLISKWNDVRIIPFSIGEDLPVFEDERRKKQMHILNAHLADGTSLPFIQEPSEGGFSVVLPFSATKGQKVQLTVELKGDFMKESDVMSGTYFPRSTETWYPRHGYLGRSRFDISMLHRKKDQVVSLGEMVKEAPSNQEKDAVLTQFSMQYPIALATFAVGPYEIHRETAKEDNGTQLPLEFYSMPTYKAQIKESFILAEMNNCVRFFSKLYGEYPYPLFRGVYHPFDFGQGFATTIMIPATDQSTYSTYSFIAHETSHQWWGDMVLWRSYRDQWLSEGFAEYSGMLYVQQRDKTSSEKELIKRARESLKMPPRNLTGLGSGRLVDVGPLVMGHRLESRETRGAYSALTYDKGALVLRMMHFLFTDPQTGKGDAFLDLMTEFVRRYKDRTATTEQFFAVANDRVRETPLSRKYGYKDLNWFYRQWVTQSYLPSYEFDYDVENDSAGGVIIKGELLQSNLPDEENWFMPLPLVIHYSGGKLGYGTVAVQGKRTPINIRLQQRPEKIELDPDLWVLSDKTSTHKQ